MLNEYSERIKLKPDRITNMKYRYDSFDDGLILLRKKKNHLPIMGWNSWNAFGSGNTEKLTMEMADAIVNLGLDKLGYKYVVLDDGCYKANRVNGKLSNETEKFPSGFSTLGEYIHSKGLKFGMYNDIGTNLCAGAAVGTCGYEDIDAKSYIGWGIDFIKVDNCYYPWDNATFSDEKNAKYVYAPNIREIKLSYECIDKNNENKEYTVTLKADSDGIIVGNGPYIENGYVTNIGTLDGTGPKESPNKILSGELHFVIDAPYEGYYILQISYATGMEVGVGNWLQIGIFHNGTTEVIFDDEMKETDSIESFVKSNPFRIFLNAGNNVIRLMNHRRQENTLLSYATFLEKLNEADPNHDIIYSICEWGKTQPHNWGYKVGDSWRILNDITFQVGSDGDYGVGDWSSDYTPGIATQYNKAVIMDEYAGIDKGWNDPDMLMIGMNGISDTMARTQMAMWCMMNSPLMLGLDLRRIKKGDEIYNIIANERVIEFNQDKLGIQAKRVFCSLTENNVDTMYITDNNRVDIIAKPLYDGSVAISFINLSDVTKDENYSVDVSTIVNALGEKMINKNEFCDAENYTVLDVWNNSITTNSNGVFQVNRLEPYDNMTIKISPQ